MDLSCEERLPFFDVNQQTVRTFNPFLRMAFVGPCPLNIKTHLYGETSDLMFLKNATAKINFIFFNQW